jgi:GTP-binding nuclear protein Ran
MKHLKILLVGDAEVGKTHYIEKMLTNNLSSEQVRRSSLGTSFYKPTIGSEIHTLRFTSDKSEDIFVNVWDIAGDEKHGGLRDAYFLGADAVIYFVDGKPGLKNWPLEVERVCPKIPGTIIDRKNAEERPDYAFRKLFEKIFGKHNYTRAHS